MLQYIILVYKNKKVADIFDNPEQLLNKVAQVRDGVATSAWIYNDRTIRIDLNAIDAFEKEYTKDMEETNMSNNITCPICGKPMKGIEVSNNIFICDTCKIYTNKDQLCPDCGAYTFVYESVELDNSMGSYCFNSKKTIDNQYMTHEDFVELEGEGYKDCDSIRRNEDEAARQFFKEETSVDVAQGDYKFAYQEIMAFRNKGMECSESECDSCPLQQAITRANFTYDERMGYATCADFLEQCQERAKRANEGALATDN